MYEILRELDFTILKPYHNVSNYDGEDADYLKNFALIDNKDDDKVTHLIVRNDELIGFFTLFVNFDGDMVPLVKVEKLSLTKEYDDDIIRNFIKLSIVKNVNHIYCNYFDGVCIEMEI